VQTPVQTSPEKTADLQAGSNPVCAFLYHPVERIRERGRVSAARATNRPETAIV
jgi:hypothetical protein